MHSQHHKKLAGGPKHTGRSSRRPLFSGALALSAIFSLFVPGCTAQTSQGNKNTPPPQQQQEGEITVTPIMHASVQIEYGGKVVQVDPTSAGDYSKAKQADLVLVTDIHGDHLDPAAISRIRKPGAPVVAPSAAAPKIENATVMANGESRSVAGLSLEAVPMYNLKRGPAEGQLFHTKGRGNGYILTLGDKRVYIAGDTECTPEMRALKNIDIAFIPMNLPYTMPPAEAAECVRVFKPKVVYPYHYRGQKPEEFKAALAGEPIEVRLLEWYPTK
jgi:L-ascorbate metabolism protein UlaG (beta-lactamase superfamily)